jgi:hypothetical protein
VLALAAASASAAPPRPTASASAPEATAGAAPASPSAPVSLSARKVYEQARSQLVQIRTVLKGRASQTSVGSGFFVTDQGHIVTNFHVVSEVALKPESHDLVYVTADGREAPLQILQLDVLHDLALLRAGDAAGRSFDALPFRPADEPLAQGERIYSLGNPLDVGFAVTQGTYNGLVKRSFYPQIFFGGALSAGMSGGPALDDEGHIVGINVARRVDGEQVSFLVPAEFATALLARGKDAAPLLGPAYVIVDEQLLKHQARSPTLHRPGLEGRDPSALSRAGAARRLLMRCWERARCRRLAVSTSSARPRHGHAHLRRLRPQHRHDRPAPRGYDGSSSAAAIRRAPFGELRNGRSRLSAQHQTKPRCNGTSSIATACRCAPSSACARIRSCRSSTTSQCWSRRSTRALAACRAASRAGRPCQRNARPPQFDAPMGRPQP